ncbi:nucleolin isoform X2 [Hyalella azteca]|uniref:Nucleolin isoform X2 n=1 Tax=Hyalella azteca TaxID=294128 RepID=A0A979FGY3_HYAAZ|nr:nucleolin isoform X2 [Hyalella azteca]
MFWILKTPRLAANFLQNFVGPANNKNKEATKSRHKDGYGRLSTTDEELIDHKDVNGNAVLTRTSALELSSPSSASDYNNFVSTTDDEDDDESEFDDDEDAEALTCDVCERAFASSWQLQSHQAKKRHYGCSTCESVFRSLSALETHKEENHHWSDEDLFLDHDDDEDEDDEYETGFYDDDEDDEEEKENLL